LLIRLLFVLLVGFLFVFLLRLFVVLLVLAAAGGRGAEQEDDCQATGEQSKQTRDARHGGNLKGREGGTRRNCRTPGWKVKGRGPKSDCSDVAENAGALRMERSSNLSIALGLRAVAATIGKTWRLERILRYFPHSEHETRDSRTAHRDHRR